MKILLSVDCYPDTINGVASSVLTLKKALEKRGHQVKLLTLNRSHHSKKIGTDIYALGSRSVERIYPDARMSFRFNSKLIEELILWHPDIVHTNNEFATFVASVRIARECNIPLIHTYHTVYEDYTHYFSPSERFGKRMVKELSKTITKVTDSIIVPTEKIKDLLETYEIIKKIYVIPTGIDLEKFSKAPDEQWILEKKKEYGILNKNIAVFIGRAAKEKNIEELIDIFKDVDEKNVLLIVGDGPDRGFLEEKAKGFKNIVFTGMVDRNEVENYYHLGDVFVSASTSETQGLTYYEAMAASLPLVCKKDPCLEDILINDVNGYQCEETIDFKEKILLVLNDKEKQERMRLSSQKIADKYSVENFGKSVEEVYKNAIENNYEKDDAMTHMVEMNSDVMNAYQKLRNIFTTSVLFVEEEATSFLIPEDESTMISFWKEKHVSEMHENDYHEEDFEYIFTKENDKDSFKCRCKKCMIKAIIESEDKINFEDYLINTLHGELRF